MEKVILKSMVDFVLEQDEEPILGLISHYYRKIRRYANFLNKPLNLGMFVPAKLVDGVWVVLEEPKCECKTEYDREGCYEKCYEFVNAKNRVLFEVWSYKKDFMGFKKVYNSDFQINLDTLDCEFYIDGMHYEDFKLKGNNIESLSNQLSAVLLTQTAQKQLGL